MKQKGLWVVLLLVVLLELFGVAWLYLGVEYTCRCGGCDLYPHVLAYGKCTACPTTIGSMSDLYCDSCAHAKGVCRDCGTRKRWVRGVEDPWSPRW
jgi:hypothetical protein